MYGDTCSLFDDIHLSDRFGWDGAGTASETGCALFDDVHGLTGLAPGPMERGEYPPSDDQVGDDPELHCVPAVVVPLTDNRCQLSYPDQMAVSAVRPFRMLRPKRQPSARSPVTTGRMVGLPEIRSTKPPVAVDFQGTGCRGHPQGQGRQWRLAPHLRYRIFEETLNFVWAMSLLPPPQVWGDALSADIPGAVTAMDRRWAPWSYKIRIPQRKTGSSAPRIQAKFDPHPAEVVSRHRPGIRPCSAGFKKREPVNDQLPPRR